LINNINNYDAANNKQWLLTYYNKYIPKSDRLPVEKLIDKLNTCDCMTKYRSYVDIFNIPYENLPLQIFMNLLCRHGGESHLNWFNRLHESNYLSMNLNPWIPFAKWTATATEYDNVLVLDYLLQQVTVTSELLKNIIDKATALKNKSIVKYIIKEYCSFGQCIKEHKKYIKDRKRLRRNKRYRRRHHRTNSSDDESSSEESISSGESSSECNSEESSSDAESGKKCRIKNKLKPTKSIFHKINDARIYKAVYQ